ncbi:hypothetical protein L1281_001625 [Neisseria sp. HSC-16F19]|nr:hypothetical protein [Neisseria sp. HSC-16F19]MCP2041031.1 hypothetical protein [Neisseria sp. HSC-16F19]
MMYLALYKGRKRGWKPRDVPARLGDWLTRTVTRGPYSHCELAVSRTDGQFDCYTASVRDGGVRHKTMPLPADKWDLLPLSDHADLQQSLAKLYAQTQGQPYDWPGAAGFVLRTHHRKDKWFCSEWCGQVLGLPESWRFSPNDLAAVVKRGGQV